MTQNITNFNTLGLVSACFVNRQNYSQSVNCRELHKDSQASVGNWIWQNLKKENWWKKLILASANNLLTPSMSSSQQGSVNMQVITYLTDKNRNLKSLASHLMVKKLFSNFELKHDNSLFCCSGETFLLQEWCWLWEVITFRIGFRKIDFNLNKCNETCWYRSFILEETVA